jgi:NAD(P)-dependent dehydrogenase (short-subunit alcohol dehydrogenase family)
MANSSGSITPESVFVVSGGAKGITAECVIRLARHYRCKFILLGRSARNAPESAWVSADSNTDELELRKQVSAYLTAQGEKPSPARVQRIVQSIRAEHEISTTLQAVEQAGGQAEYVSVDVTNLDAVQAHLPPAIQRMGGSVTGIIHGAGSLADKLIEKKTLDDFERVYTVKVTGLQNLLTCISVSSLRYLVLFSSVAGFYGNIGQSDYAMANEILNKTAHLIRRSYPDCRVVAMNWGPWDGGMVTPALKQYFAEHQIDVIPIEAGAQMLIRELEGYQGGIAQVVVGHAIQTAQSQPGTELRSFRIHRRLKLEANPFLYDHVIGDHAVLPAVSSMAWISNVCEQLYPGYTFFSCGDYRVLKGIVFDETVADTYTLDLKEATKNEDEIAFDTLIWSTTPNGKQRFHYRSQVVLRRTLPDAPRYEKLDLSETHGVPGTQLYEDGTMFHGPCFQGVERVLNISQHGLTMQCVPPEVTAHQQGQFPIQTFHPYLVDVQLQSVLIWVRHVHQAGCLPLRVGKMEQFRKIAPGERFYVSTEIQTSTESKVIANVFAYDAEGTLYTYVSDIEVTVSARLNTLFAKARGGGLVEQRS